MNEDEWLTATDPIEMMWDHLRKNDSVTARLPAFVASFAEGGRIRELLAGEMRAAFDDYVRWVQEDGPNPTTLYPKFGQQRHWMQGIDTWSAEDTLGCLIGHDGRYWGAVYSFMMAEIFNKRTGSSFDIFGKLNANVIEWRSRQADRVREVVGNPFRPVTFSPAWCTDTALSLARQMYDSRDFIAMPILADALQDAGCDNEDVLAHCRGPGPHVRGCWVVDLVLGKE